MSISSKEVAAKEFVTGFGSGYKKDDVDSFKKEVAKQLSLYEKAFHEFKKNEYKKKAQLYDSSKEEISNIMINAQSQAEKIKQETERELAIARRKAEEEHNQLLLNAKAKSKEIIDAAQEAAQQMRIDAINKSNQLIEATTRDCEVLKTGFDATKLAVQGWHNHVEKLTGELITMMKSPDWNDLLNKDLEIFIPESIELKDESKLELVEPSVVEPQPTEDGTEVVNTPDSNVDSTDPLAQLVALENKTSNAYADALATISEQEQQFLKGDF